MEGTSSKGCYANKGIEADTSLSLFNHGKESQSSESYEISEKQVATTDERCYKRSKQRHTPEQTQELEGFFKRCMLPNRRERQKLSQKLGLEATQIKFWFQNKRTHVKAQTARDEKNALKLDCERLRMEVAAMKAGIGNPQCKDCRAPVFDEQLRMENAQLKELIRVCGMIVNPIAKPTPLVANSFTQPGIGNISLELTLGRGDTASGLSLGGSNPLGRVKPGNGFALASSSLGFVSSEYLQAAVSAMNELIVLAHDDSPFWLKSSDGERETFDKELYLKRFNYHGANPFGLLYEATRAAGLVMNTSSELVNTLMDPVRWPTFFPGMIGKVSVIEVLSSGVETTHDGKLLMMSADLLYPSPLVPLRHIRFIRYCKKHPDGTWAVVDVSVDPPSRKGYADVPGRCRMLPSGCLVKNLPNGYSLVTFLEHFEYDESTIHSLYRRPMQSGLCYGAKRWLSTLQRKCGCSAYLATSTRPKSHIGFTREGFESILKLTKRVVDGFHSGICASSVCRWKKLKIGNITPEMQVMTQVNISETGQLGIIMSLATSVWLPISRHKLFDFLRNPHLRAQWDMLSPVGPLQEVVRIIKSPDFADRVSILLPPVTPDMQVSTAILQEAWEDEVSSAVVFSAVDIAAITEVMEGGDPGIVRLLPSGFLIADGILVPKDLEGEEGPRNGSLLTLGFQILMASAPTAKITEESIETVNCLMDITVRKIEAALAC